MTAYPLNDTSWISSIKSVENVNSVKLPAFYKTQFTLPVNYTKCLDTYLDTSGWTKVCYYKLILLSQLLSTYLQFNKQYSIFTGCSVFKQCKPWSVLATWWTSSHTLCASSFFKTITLCQYTSDVGT